MKSEAIVFYFFTYCLCLPLRLYMKENDRKLAVEKIVRIHSSRFKKRIFYRKSHEKPFLGNKIELFILMTLLISYHLISFYIICIANNECATANFK